jgi:hypothetical protein
VIVETQSLTTIAVGAQKAQTEAGDTALRIPNLILPSVELMEPTSIQVFSATVNLNSFLQHRFISTNNQAAFSYQFCTLGKGLWLLRFNWTLKQTLAAPVAFNTNGNYVRIAIPPGGTTSILATFNPIQSGSFDKSWETKVLLRENAEIQLGTDVTGAADFLDMNLCLNAVKLL